MTKKFGWAIILWRTWAVILREPTNRNHIFSNAGNKKSSKYSSTAITIIFFIFSKLSRDKRITNNLLYVS